MTGTYQNQRRHSNGEFGERINSEANESLNPTEVHAPDIIDEPEPRRYTIPAYALSTAQRRIDIANRKLARAGITDRFDMCNITEGTETHPTDRTVRDVVSFELNHPVISAGGYTFLGRVDELPDGTPFIVGAPGVDTRGIEVSSAQQCDHCGTHRQRNKTYILRDGDGNVSQVGSTCLTPLLGVRPAGLWALEYDLDITEDTDDAVERGGGGGGWEPYAPTEDVLAVALAVSNEGRDYVTRDDLNGRISTAAHVNNNLFPTSRWADSDEHHDIMQRASSPDIRAAAKEVHAWALAVPGDSDWADKVRALANQDNTRNRHVGILASAVSGWARDKQRTLEREALPSFTDEWVAPPKTKIADIPATVTRVRYIDGTYGTTTLIAMRGSDGHDITWFASGWKDIDAGDKVTIAKATVKANDMYEGKKQTTITRATLVTGDDGANKERNAVEPSG